MDETGPTGPQLREGIEDATKPSAAPDIEQKSVLLKLDRDGALRGGVSLREIAEETSLPPIQMGSDRYQVLKAIGQGGMGSVFLVYDRDLKRKVALKVIREASRAKEVRFVEEAQVMGQLQHPNIVTVHELGLAEGSKPYYTMPELRGRSLRDVLQALRAGAADAQRTWSLTRLVQVFLQIAQALSYAHAKGVVHRDLKPANVMLGEHGEVQVIDWGLAKLLDGSDIERASSGPKTSMDLVAGTPAYMAPEQVQRGTLDGRTDVYALGVMLYEFLTLRRPFEGDGNALMAQVVIAAPRRPREVARGRNVPLELERVTLKALSKDPAERQQTAGELHDEVQRWLEAESDRERRRAIATAKAEQGRTELEEYRRQKLEVRRLAAEAEETAARFEDWQPVEEKGELVAAQDRARDGQRELVRSASRVVATFEKALGFDDENAAARELLSDYYWDRFCDAEERSDADGVSFHAERVAAYHDGKYARELRGDGQLKLETDPPGAEATLHELVEEGFVLLERNGRRLGETPLGPIELAMGSYVVVLEKEGYRATRYPVCITRNKAWEGRLRLRTEADIGAGFLYVPAGPFVMGGDKDSTTSLPRSEPWVEDFVIGEHPVTNGEYLEFLNELARTEGLEAAKGRAPRYRYDQPGSTYLLEDGAAGLKLPEVDAEGDRWETRFPAFGISCFDAVAYCAWRSARDGREYRLPTEAEWEKAARGVDGRWFPWGWRFDASLCNMRSARRERMAPVAVDEFPRDVSVYGVRGLGGNAQDWTSTELFEGTGDRRRVSIVYKGGCWGSTVRGCGAALRLREGPGVVSDYLGFRLARGV